MVSVLLTPPMQDQSGVFLTEPRIVLQREFAIRQQANPRFSLRTFAKRMGINHSMLSLCLSGKRTLSEKTKLKIAAALGFDAVKAQCFVRGVEWNLGDPDQGLQLSLDEFSILSDWYHFAILSLLKIKKSQFDAKWISHSLDIPPLVAQLAMDRLVKLNLVKQNKNGKWKRTEKPIRTENIYSTAATKKYHTDLLQKAQYSLQIDPVNKREFSAMVLAMNPSVMAYAKERIRKFRRELATELEQMAEPTHVYHMGCQLYPVSNTEKELL